MIVIIIFLAFASYSWLDLRASQAPKTSEYKYKKRAPAPQPERVIGAEEFYAKARLFHKSGRFEEAARLYRETLRIEPGYVNALNNLGVIYIHKKDYRAAQSNFEKAIRLKPGYVDPYYNLTCLHALKGETKQSLAHLTKAVSLDRSVRDWARTDTDLENLRGVPEFEDIIGRDGVVE